MRTLSAEIGRTSVRCDISLYRGCSPTTSSAKVPPFAATATDRSRLHPSAAITSVTGNAHCLPDQLTRISPFIVVPTHDSYQVTVDNLRHAQVHNRGARIFDDVA